MIKVRCPSFVGSSPTRALILLYEESTYWDHSVEITPTVIIYAEENPVHAYKKGEQTHSAHWSFYNTDVVSFFFIFYVIQSIGNS